MRPKLSFSVDRQFLLHTDKWWRLMYETIRRSDPLTALAFLPL